MCFSSGVRRLVLLVPVLLVLPFAVRAQEGAAEPAAARDEPVVTDPPPEPSHQDIRGRIDALEESEGGREHASAALDHARLALRRARELEARGDSAGAERARRIAWAALSLASRQVALARERQALRAAGRRLSRAEERARQARTALSHAIAQRERMRAPVPVERTAPVEEIEEQDPE